MNSSTTRKSIIVLLSVFVLFLMGDSLSLFIRTVNTLPSDLKARLPELWRMVLEPTGIILGIGSIFSYFITRGCINTWTQRHLEDRPSKLAFDP